MNRHIFRKILISLLFAPLFHTVSPQTPIQPASCDGTIHHCLALNTGGITTTGGVNPHTGRIVNDNDGDLSANFHIATGSTDPFAGWSTTAWHFAPSAIHLPRLRTTTCPVINDQPVLIRIDYSNRLCGL